MVRRNVWPCRVMRSGKRIPTILSGKARWRNLASVMTVAGVMMGSVSGLAEEATNEKSQSQIDAGLDDALTPSHPAIDSAEHETAADPHNGDLPGSWVPLLQSLTTSSQRKELITDLGALIGKGDLAGAKQLLSATIEVGTLAIIIVDSIEEPALQARLKAMAAEMQVPAAPPPSQVSADMAAKDARLAELEAAVERERSRADAALQDLNAVKEELGSLKANESKTSDLNDALTREKDRADAALKELATVREQQSALEAEIAEATGLRNALGDERERVAALTRELGNAKERFAALESLQGKTAALNEAMEQEKQRADASARELQAARKQLAALTTSETELAELKGALEREKDQAASALLELKRAQDQIAVSKASAAEAADLRTMLERERSQSASAAHEAEVLKEQLAALKTAKAKTADVENSIALERQRADGAFQQVIVLQQELSARKANDTKVRNDMEKEKERTAFTSRQLESALGKIAALTADTAGINDALRREKEKSASTLQELSAIKRQLAALESRTEFLPAALIFQTPLTLPDFPAYPPRNGAERGTREDKGSGSPPRKAREVSLPPETRVPGEPAVDETRPQPRGRKPAVKPEDFGAAKPASEIRTQSAAPDRKISARTGRVPRPSVQESYQAPDGRAPGLPAALRPDERFWQFY